MSHYPLSDYRGDRLFRQAMERNLEIIGEVVSHISEHRQIVAFRNRLILGYDLLDDELVRSA